ncbi:MAG: ABC transporter substrate-binding protein [Gammaproteobacteria bacterium]|nr:ABC transporter substrate-binding protein [Gammaproteobacteria bacterium]
MRVVSHTCSNTEIVCALGCASALVAVDADSDFPPDVVAPLPKLGRDLALDTAAVARLRPDLVLSSLTLPGHEAIVGELQQRGLPTLVCDPTSLEDVYRDILRIAAALSVFDRGRTLVEKMRAAMPPVPTTRRPPVLIEWWPKPVIAPARRSWASDVVRLAGGVNPFVDTDLKSVQVDADRARQANIELIVLSWCGVKVEKYRADVVGRRDGWQEIPAVERGRIVPISETYLGRPGPRLVEGYRLLRESIAALI